MIRKIEFRYSKDTIPDPGVEMEHKNNINMRLSELADELNKENVTVEYSVSTNRITFRNISPGLHKRAIEELSRFDI